MNPCKRHLPSLCQIQIIWLRPGNSKSFSLDRGFFIGVEKVPKQILGGDAGKNDPTECARINDLTITRGH